MGPAQSTSSSELEVKARAGILFPMPPSLTIGQVSRRSGVASSAIRFYEQRGLMRSERAGSGHRRYPQAVLRRIAFIVFAQRGVPTMWVVPSLEEFEDHDPSFGL